MSEEDGEHLYILYEFIEGKEVDPEQDAEAIMLCCEISARKGVSQG